jgi:hypothetical protein
VQGSLQVLIDFEHGAEAGDLKKLMDSPREMKKFNIAPPAARGSITGYQRREPYAIEIGDLSQIQDDA